MSSPGFDPIHLDDLIACVKCSSDTFDQLELLFRLIKEKAAAPETVKTLAEIGAGLAFDGANFADCQHEQATEGGVHHAP